jgi:membrane-associated phospholipid phosphatase
VIGRWDRAVVEAFQHAHWGPADWCFELLSDWWVKSLLIIGVAVLADLRSRRLPVGGLLATVSYFVAGVIAELLKQAVDRPRPSLADPAVHPLVQVPGSGSMPSGHAATAFAAAVAAGLVHPRLRRPLLVLAALIALSRVWLGVHYLSDILVGAALGSAVAVVAWLILRGAARASRERATPSSARAPSGDGAGSRRPSPPAPSASSRRAPRSSPAEEPLRGGTRRRSQR